MIIFHKTRQAFCLVGAFIFVLIMATINMVAKLGVPLPIRRAMQRFTYAGVAKFWHMRITTRGEQVKGPAMLVSNHCSYVDVMVLGAMGAVRFTPKKDVKGWPVIGWIVQQFDVIFVDRSPRAARQAQKDIMDALQDGDRICVFPEGTTNNGRNLQHFKPSLFSLAEQWAGGEKLPVQPVAIRYHSVNGKPMDDEAWDQIAWYGDDELVPHMWNICGIGHVDVEIIFLPPVIIAEDETRKMLAARCYDAISEQLPAMRTLEQQNT